MEQLEGEVEEGYVLDQTLIVDELEGEMSESWIEMV